ncbi:metallophosphoesterase family protein [Neptuniibacter halophilus]|uniref:metallophosphoesterase family protein n=1 Tax=Neptuniibacter halophilus TaxID=651666 RepID=UPI0025735AAA|nr:metallophosphoesterase [Neptuniibacter halophilus]
MSRLAHISDLHFGRHNKEVMAGLLDTLGELDPDLVVISGDLTQRATHKEYRKAQRFLAGLIWPSLVIPGNHDITAYHLAERLFYPWRKWRRYINPELEPDTRLPGLRVMGVNSARRFGWYLDWSRGRINQDQTEMVARQAATAAETDLRIMVAHHPFWLPTLSLRRQLIGGYEEALPALNAAGVDLILGGHIHLPFFKIQEGVIISHAGTSISNRLVKGQANSFNIIEGDRQQLRISVMEWDGNRFSERQAKSFRRGRGGWD